jgi:hypothetical protein
VVLLWLNFEEKKQTHHQKNVDTSKNWSKVYNIGVFPPDLVDAIWNPRILIHF